MSSSNKKMSQRPYGSQYENKRLPERVSMVGLGCSSFSTFFWSSDELQQQQQNEPFTKSHPRVQEWIQTIHYAIQEAGITLLDTAPWYGHGLSEQVIGWALQDTDTSSSCLDRNQIIINTKVGRYQADPLQQFDYSYSKTMASVQESLKRLQCSYINVLQLHDPEFAPSLHQLLEETIPAMMKCLERGYCKALGMTGYSFKVQHQILQASLERFQTNIWDQALTYGHFNLHDTSLLSTSQQPFSNNNNSLSFAEYCHQHQWVVLAAAPLSMGLLTNQGPPSWHPASPQLQMACRRAAKLCQQQQVDIATLALLVALSEPRIPCTILGMKDQTQVQQVEQVVRRLTSIDNNDELSHEAILKHVLTHVEYQTWKQVIDPVHGPFANVWKNGTYQWDGVAQAHTFWKQLEGNDIKVEHWQAR